MHDPAKEREFLAQPNPARFAELRLLIAKHAVRVGEACPVLPNLTVMAAHAPTPPVPSVTEPMFALVAQGAKRIGLGDKVLNYGAGQYLTVSVDLPLQGHVVLATPGEPFLGLALSLKPAAIAALLLETGEARPARAESAGFAISNLTDELIDPVVRLLRLKDRPADIPVLGPSIEREIYWRLIHGSQGAMVRQIGLADSRVGQIGRAIHWIREHYADTIRVEELARVAGMSVTSLHRHFRGITNLTPIQYQKQIRLQAARSRLMAGAEDVAQVGFEVGYDNPSQFSREYRRLFGWPPGQDGRRLRRAGGECG